MISLRTVDVTYSMFDNQPSFLINSLTDKFLILNGTPSIFGQENIVNLIIFQIIYWWHNVNCNSFADIDQLLILIIIISSNPRSC